MVESESDLTPKARLGLDESTGAKLSEPFAPFFTIRTQLALGPAQSAPGLMHPTPGSLSFGPTGFSIVCDGGRHWERLDYRDVTKVRQEGDSVLLTVRDVESRLKLYHPWLPSWLSQPRRSRAQVFVEMLGRVRGGLTPYEIDLYRRRLQ